MEEISIFEEYGALKEQSALKLTYSVSQCRYTGKGYSVANFITAYEESIKPRFPLSVMCSVLPKATF